MCQFTGESDATCLKQFIPIPNVYPCGRLDKNSEGLLLLSSDGTFIHRYSDPRSKMPKGYWVQVEGEPSSQDLIRLSEGIEISVKHNGKRILHRCASAQYRMLQESDVDLAPRVPPIRKRLSIPTSWIEIVLTEGKNHQVRHMLAALGFPVLRLVRKWIGAYQLSDLKAGHWCYAQGEGL